MIISAANIGYNGWTASAALAGRAGGVAVSGYQLKTLDISRIQNDEYIEKRPLQEGSNVGDAYSGERTLTIRAGVYGSTLADFADQMEAMMAAFNAPIAQMVDTASKNHESRVTSQGFIPLTFDLPTVDTATYTSGLIPLQFFARPLASPTTLEDQDAQGGKAGNGAAAIVTVQLLTREPFAFSQALHSADVTSDMTGVTVRGDAPTALILQIHVSTNSATPGITNVWVANADAWADQAGVGPAARHMNTSFLFVDDTDVPTPTSDELTLAKPANVYISGGTATVSANTETQLLTYALTSTVREGGSDRFHTSGIIALQTFSAVAPVSDIFVFSGDDDSFYPDAISAAMGAASKDCPTLCISNDGISARASETIDALVGLCVTSVTTIHICASTTVLDASIASELAGYGTVVRHSGVDRYQSNTLVSVACYSTTTPAVLVVSGTEFADGMIASSLVGKYGGPVLLVGTSLSSYTKTELLRLKPTTIYIIGGTGVVPNSVATTLQSYCTTVTRYAGTNRYTTAVAVLQNTQTLAGAGGFIRIANWSAKAPFGPGPYVICKLTFTDFGVNQDYVFNPDENIVFTATGGPLALVQRYLVDIADEVPPGSGGVNVAPSMRDACVTSVTAYWRDRWVF